MEPVAVHTLDLRFQGEPGVIAAFLVEGPEGLALIETGPGSTLPALREGLAGLGVAPERVGDVFVTHIHLDHAGAAGWWARQGATVHVHPRGAAHLIDPARLLESARMVYGERMDPLWGEMLPAPAERVRAPADGEITRAAGLEIRALDTPGHARHHHAWAIGGTLFAGDVAGARLPGSDYVSVTSAPPQFDPEAYDASIARLEAEGFERLYLTHFGLFEGVAEHLAAYREAVRRASDFVRDRLREGMDAESLQVAYQAFHMEQAFRLGAPPEIRGGCQLANPAAMCADGIRLYWEKRFGNPN